MGFAGIATQQKAPHSIQEALVDALLHRATDDRSVAPSGLLEEQRGAIPKAVAARAARRRSGCPVMPEMIEQVLHKPQ
jgi:hypothetical protein